MALNRIKKIILLIQFGGGGNSSFFFGPDITYCPGWRHTKNPKFSRPGVFHHSSHNQQIYRDFITIGSCYSIVAQYSVKCKMHFPHGTNTPICFNTLFLNPFIAPACTFSGLKSAHIHAWKWYIWWFYNNSPFNTVNFNRSPFTCSCEDRKKP